MEFASPVRSCAKVTLEGNLLENLQPVGEKAVAFPAAPREIVTVEVQLAEEDR